MTATDETIRVRIADAAQPASRDQLRDLMTDVSLLYGVPVNALAEISAMAMREGAELARQRFREAMAEGMVS